MYSDILATVATKDDQQKLLAEVDLLVESLYKTGEGSFENVLKKNIRGNTAGYFQKSADFLKGLKEEIEKMKLITLDIGYEPTRANVEKIYGWIKTNIGANFVLNFEVNKQIFAGAVIVYEGLYKDYTLHAEL